MVLNKNNTIKKKLDSISINILASLYLANIVQYRTVLKYIRQYSLQKNLFKNIDQFYNIIKLYK